MSKLLVFLSLSLSLCVSLISAYKSFLSDSCRSCMFITAWLSLGSGKRKFCLFVFAFFSRVLCVYSLHCLGYSAFSSQTHSLLFLILICSIQLSGLNEFRSMSSRYRILWLLFGTIFACVVECFASSPTPSIFCVWVEKDFSRSTYEIDLMKLFPSKSSVPLFKNWWPLIMVETPLFFQETLQQRNKTSSLDVTLDVTLELLMFQRDWQTLDSCINDNHWRVWLLSSHVRCVTNNSHTPILFSFHIFYCRLNDSFFFRCTSTSDQTSDSCVRYSVCPS